MRWLADGGFEVTVADITVTPPPRHLLVLALGQVGRSRMLNTSGRRYRELGAATVRAWSDEELLDALASDGRLLKRPFLVIPGEVILTGFHPEQWQAALVTQASP